jgi:hypothetical protein
MSDLVVIEFPSEAKAEEVRQKLLDMQKEYLIELEDAVIAIKQAERTGEAEPAVPPCGGRSRLWEHVGTDRWHDLPHALGWRGPRHSLGGNWGRPHRCGH